MKMHMVGCFKNITDKPLKLECLSFTAKYKAQQESIAEYNSFEWSHFKGFIKLLTTDKNVGATAPAC